MRRDKNVARERTAARAAALLMRVVALSRPRNLLWGFYSKDSARTGRQERVRDADRVAMAGTCGCHAVKWTLGLREHGEKRHSGRSRRERRPPRAALRQTPMSPRAFRCCGEAPRPQRSRNSSPCWQTTAATSSRCCLSVGGRPRRRGELHRSPDLPADSGSSGAAARRRAGSARWF